MDALSEHARFKRNMILLACCLSRFCFRLSTISTPQISSYVKWCACPLLDAQWSIKSDFYRGCPRYRENGGLFSRLMQSSNSFCAERWRSWTWTLQIYLSTTQRPISGGGMVCSLSGPPRRCFFHGQTHPEHP